MEKSQFTGSGVAEVELVYRSRVKASQRPQVRTSLDAYMILSELWEEGTMDLQESFKVLMLNRGNKILCLYNASSGGITGTVADPRLIFTAALKASAVSIILAHNHPSGLLLPSRADEELTAKLKGAGHLLDIRVADHLILTSETYYSFADEGLI
ncbi:DNA repair protein radc [Cnuella takakiae]|uniref:DNA repair protein radc n=1 Tax=Cnuella takakiae TaxID=1302690 RepID=A0A1M4Z688_9BACT|nr:JAB domain-containing protein [Cnuella takakiae]OLY94319.1 DNA repair protein [Cnuella takakiae]SHF13510.1 DNA repair protein radc [Cnuella takakiae]